MEEIIIKMEVPVALVRTWINLVRNSETDQEVKTRVLSMLKEKVGTPDQISSYMKKHNIK